MKTYRPMYFYIMQYFLPVVLFFVYFERILMESLEIDVFWFSNILFALYIIASLFFYYKFRLKKKQYPIHIFPIGYEERKEKGLAFLVLCIVVYLGFIITACIYINDPGLISKDLISFFNLLLILLLIFIVPLIGMLNAPASYSSVKEIWVQPKKFATQTHKMDIFEFNFSEVITVFKMGEKLVVDYWEEGKEKKLEFDIPNFREKELEPLTGNFK